MKPQHQQQGDDCIRVCVATILEVPIEDVPNFMADAGDESLWVEELRRWLEPLGLSAMCVVFHDGSDGEVTKGVICAAGGHGPRGRAHMVVWKDGEMVWDPHPDGGGIIGEPEDYLLFLPLDPSKAISR